MGVFKGTMITATVSGTTSNLTGGKFANGAVTGAFVHMFNAMSKYELEMMRKQRVAVANAFEKTFGEKAHSYMFDKTPLVNGVIRVVSYGMYAGSFTSRITGKVFNELVVKGYAYFSGFVAGSGIGLISNASGIDPIGSYNEFISNMIDKELDKYK